MPNTLVHFAAQGAATRGVRPALDPRWVYLGCLLPDVPWILRRVVDAASVPVDPIDLRVYTMGLASLFATLLLAAACAALTARPRLVFGVLGANALLHLLLDATEVKWGNGVHLLAPFSWRMTSFGLVTGEGALVAALSVVGAALVAWELVRQRVDPVPLRLDRRRMAASAGLVACYLLAPLPFHGALLASDSYSVRTLKEVAAREGRSVSFDRTAFVATPEGGFLETWTGERIRAVGSVPSTDALVSLRGTFLAPDVLRVDALVEHRRNRDWPSYVALALLVALWLRPRRRVPDRTPTG